MQNTITEIKNSLESANSRILEAEEGINKVEDRLVEMTDAEQKREKDLKEMKSLRELWDNVKCTNTRIIGGSRRRRERAGDRKNISRDNSRRSSRRGAVVNESD